MEKKSRIYLGIGLIFSLVFPLVGQGPEQDLAARERMRKNLNRLRLLRMTEELELSEKQTAVLFPAAVRLEKEKAEISRKIHLEIRDLRAYLRSGTPDKQEVARKVKKIKELRQSIQEKDAEFERILDENLEEIQKARYLIFTIDFHRALEEKLDRARKILPKKGEL